MKILQKVIVTILIILAILIVIAYLLPSYWHVERSVVIDSNPEDIHVYVQDLKKWPEWTVWNEQSDPSLTFRYEGPDSGAGATQIWTSKKMGSGQVKLTRSDPESGVWYELQIEESGLPSNGSLTYEIVDDGTRVNWSATGELGNNPINRYFGILIESMLGSDFDKGLAALKKKVEAAPSGGHEDVEE